MKYMVVLFLLSLFLVGCGAVPKDKSQLPTGVTPTAAAAAASTPPANAPPAAGPSPGSTTSNPAQTMQCAAGEYDMLDWATLDPDLASGYHLEGNANPLYTYVQSDKFYWLKSANGYPWDIQLVDSKNIYLWVTEQDWSDPYTYKKSHNNTNMALTPRCAQGGQSQPGTIVKSKDTSFEIVNRCTTQKVTNLGTMANEVWGPYKMSFGGDIPDNTDTLIVAYKYNCDPGYGNCQDREEYFLTQRYGLVRWDHGKFSGGKYNVDKFTIYNKLKPGAAAPPQFPCG